MFGPNTAPSDAVRADVITFDNRMPEAANVHTISYDNSKDFSAAVGYGMDRGWQVTRFAAHVNAANRTVFSALLVRAR